ncbi:MAG: DNA polymerase III subunit beta [Rickettsiaceae bacterium]|nr:DNA polymerase III subunit beta [Rickettsiaceae bacterium]MDP4832822.1 DNA polymerase III subunit beta [Rickettsiaceae bacterium]MDP5020793.1 DNA polymerase III subunit beta [Rickettsiaceae bacterium]MDP5083371.1 DNA polymerase III subunit beta [Rickettsiaceae bacterium]
MTNKSNLEVLIQTKDLVHALSFASSVVEKRNVLSELSNIKLVVKNGAIEIGATDMDLYLKQDIGAEVIFEGETTVSTQTISDIIRKIPDTEIRLKQLAESDKLEITGKNCRFELLTLPAIQFPAMEDIDSEVNLSVLCEEFARIIEYTNFAMSNEETRYNLNGIYMHVQEKKFCAVATDGHRLSIASTPLQNKVEEFGVIVPRKTVGELLKIVKDAKNIQSDIHIFLASNKIKFKCNNLILISKLIDGTFPEYSSFIPVDNENKLTISTKLLAGAIDRVATVTVDKFRAVKMSIDNKVMEITASGEAKGAASENLLFSEEANNYCSFSGSEVSIGFNPKYISDVLGALNEGKVEIYFKDAFSPVLIKTVQNPEDSFVVMPVKV